jgi:hypothetical protein
MSREETLNFCRARHVRMDPCLSIREIMDIMGDVSLDGPKLNILAALEPTLFDGIVAIVGDELAVLWRKRHKTFLSPLLPWPDAKRKGNRYAIHALKDRRATMAGEIIQMKEGIALSRGTAKPSGRCSAGTGPVLQGRHAASQEAPAR